MREAFAVLERIARTDVTLTLIGETGTGKDVLARTVHERGARAEGPFVVFDCGAIAKNLVDSELFGHERGSFTGATHAHQGAFERAHGGTLFLDEIGELPLDLQPRLLRALENRSVRRVGGRKERAVEVRLIAATNRLLTSQVSAGYFRPDLYFRLAAAVVYVPALRGRLEDMELLVPELLADLGQPGLSVSEETYALLYTHAWPGNVRELKNTLAYALAFADGGVLEPEHIRFQSSDDDNTLLDKLPLAGQPLEDIERVAIEQTLLSTGGNKTHAAQALGIAISTLYEKLRKYRL